MILVVTNIQFISVWLLLGATEAIANLILSSYQNICRHSLFLTTLTIRLIQKIIANV
jgi:hypothetical protein